MYTFSGFREVDARPMTRLEYNVYRGRVLPSSENGEDKGFIVTDCCTEHESWLPEEEFNRIYNKQKGMTFGEAIEAAKRDKKIARKGWNGKNMFVVMMQPLYLPPHNTQEPGAKVNDRTAQHIGVDKPLDSQAYFAMFTALGQWQPGWLASQADMLATDWEVVL